MPQWQQIVGENWVQWADLRLADACFRYAQELSDPRSYLGLSIEAQRQRAKDAWEWLGNGLRSLDTPPFNSPQVRGAFGRSYGTYGYESNIAVPGSYWTTGDHSPRAGVPSDHGGSLFKTEVQRLYFTQRPVSEGASTPSVVFKIRYMLDQNGLVVDPCGSANGDCYSPEPYWMSDPESGAHQIFGGEENMKNWGFWDGGPFAWLAAENVGKVLPPIEWSVAVAQEIADQFVALGALEVLTRARLNAVLLNFAMARKFNLLSDHALAVAATNLPAEMYAAATTDQTQSSKVAAQGMISIGSALIAAGAAQGTTVIGGVTGSVTLAVGAIIGAAGIAVEAAPSAVGPASSDMFGLAEPLYQRASISGGAGDARSHSRLNVPDPPGYVPARLIELPLILSDVLPVSCTPPQDFYSEALRRVWIGNHPNCPTPPPYVDPNAATWQPWAVAAVLAASLWKIFRG